MDQTVFLKLNKPSLAGTDLVTDDKFWKENPDKIDAKLQDHETHLTDIILNVKATFGVAGDGVTDDTATIQNAFSWVKNNGNAKLYFPDGIYLISNYIQVYKNTTVHFHPNAVVKRIGTYTKMFANGTISNSAYASGGYNGDGNIHFYGGTFDLNSQGAPVLSTQPMEFFALGHAQNISFNNITVKNGQIGHYFEVSSCKNVRFKDCWFGAVTYSDTSSQDYELIQIEVATATTFPSFGSYDLTISRDIYVENCTFDTVIRAIGNHSDAQYTPGVTTFCENLNVINCTFNNSFDNMLNLTGFRYSTFENNVIMNSNGYGIATYKVEDSIFHGNTILNPQKSGIELDTSHNNKFSKNIMKEIALSTTSGFSGIRLFSSNGNTFDDDTVTAITPNYTYAWYSSGSDATNPNRIVSHKYTKGKTATIGGTDSTEMAIYQLGDGQTVLMDTNTDLGTVGANFMLPHDIRNFNFLVVLGNNNSSATAQLVSYIIPKSAIIIGTTSRYRLVTTDSASSSIVEFSFPTGTSIQVDTISGTGHIRKVVGMY